MNIRRATRSFRPTVFALEQKLTLDGTVTATGIIFTPSPPLTTVFPQPPRPDDTTPITGSNTGQWLYYPAPPVSTC